MFLIHKWEGCHQTLRYGINLDWGGNTIIEIIIKIPILFLNFIFYFRMRYRRCGFPLILDSRLKFISGGT